MSITTAGRSLTGDMVTEVTASQLNPILLVQLDFPTPVYLWTGYGTLTYNSIGYLGMGTLGTISPVEEATDLSARGISIQLSGVPTALVAVALTANYQGRSCSVLFGALDNAAGIVTSPVTVFSGRMDVMSIADDGQSTQIVMNAENRLVDFRRPREIRYTHEEQLAVLSVDLGLEFVNAIQEKEIFWGNAKLAAPVIDNGGDDYGQTDYR